MQKYSVVQDVLTGVLTPGRCLDGPRAHGGHFAEVFARAAELSERLEFEAGETPGVETAGERHDVVEAGIAQRLRHPCRRYLVRTGAVDDQLPVRIVVRHDLLQ